MSLKVRVRNFQSVEDAELTIDGLTVVTGTNNAGKSAFFRGIRGAFTNARGYDFVRHGTSHCTVDITFDDGRTLTWMKGKNVNTYVVDGKEYPKVGHKVPPEAQVFGVEAVTAGKTDLWPQIAPQITGVSFLLHETGSVIAEAVADVKRVNQLSRALAACEKDRRSTRSSLKVRRADAKALNEKREAFAGLDEVVVEVEALEEKRQKADKITKATVNVAKLQRRHKAAREAVGALEGLENAEKAVPTQDRFKDADRLSRGVQEAVRLRERYQGTQAEVASLEAVSAVQEILPSEARVEYAERFRKGVQLTVDLAVKWENARKELEGAEAARTALSMVDLDDGPVVHAGKYKKALGNATGLKKRYIQNRDAVTDLDRQIREYEQELTELNEKLVNVLGDAEECPTCGGGLDHVH